MLSNELAKHLYSEYCETEDEVIKNNDYFEAKEEIKDIINELRNVLPDDKRKLILILEAAFNKREQYAKQEHYINAFKQGAKLIIEIIGSN